MGKRIAGAPVADIAAKSEPYYHGTCPGALQRLGTTFVYSHRDVGESGRHRVPVPPAASHEICDR